MFDFARIKTKRDVIVFTAKVTALVACVVSAATVLSYPAEEWLEEIRLHGGIAALVACSMTYILGGLIRKNNLLYEQLQARADRDPLTNAATRHVFFERLSAESGLSGVALMVDIDHFKKVNDTYGHLVGDRVIQSVAEILRKQVRATDIICRFGGEEFAIFLSDATPDIAARIAERMRQSVAEADLTVEGHSISLSISVGAALKGSTEDIVTSLSRADDALYRAKADGRNRVILGWPSDQPRSAHDVAV